MQITLSQQKSCEHPFRLPGKTGGSKQSPSSFTQKSAKARLCIPACKSLPWPARFAKALQGECDHSLPSGICIQTTVKKEKAFKHSISEAPAV